MVTNTVHAQYEGRRTIEEEGGAGGGGGKGGGKGKGEGEVEDES